MPFATVKSDPYAKPKRWTEVQWKRLVKASGADEPVNDEELRRLALMSRNVNGELAPF